MIANVRQELRQEVVRQTEGVRNEVVSLVLETPKSGRIYERRTVSHQASAPGEPFANDTGNTLANVRTAYIDGGMTGVVKGNENHARLEFGTRNMEPRPTMRPALTNKQKTIQAGFNAAIKRGLRRK